MTRYIMQTLTHWHIETYTLYCGTILNYFIFSQQFEGWKKHVQLTFTWWIDISKLFIKADMNKRLSACFRQDKTRIKLFNDLIFHFSWRISTEKVSKLAAKRLKSYWEKGWRISDEKMLNWIVGLKISRFSCENMFKLIEKNIGKLALHRSC